MLGPGPNREPDQALNALRTRENRPSRPSGLRFSSPSVSSRRSASSRCSSLSFAGTITFTNTCWSPRREQVREPLRAQHDPVARLRPGLDLDLLIAVEGGNHGCAAEHRLGRRDLDHADEVGALAPESVVLLHVHEHVEITGVRSRFTRVAGARDPDPLPGLDPGRDLDLPRAGAGDPAPPTALRARLLRNLARATAPLAGPRAHELAKGRLADPPDLTAAATLLARMDRRAGLGAVSATPLARHHGVERELAGRPGEDLRERDLDLCGDIAAGGGAAP